MHSAFFKSNLAFNFFPYADFKNKIESSGASLVEKYYMQPSPENNLSNPKVSKRSHPVEDKQ